MYTNWCTSQYLHALIRRKNHSNTYTLQLNIRISQKSIVNTLCKILI